MIKYLEYYPEDKGVEITLIHPGILEKTASYEPELQAFLQALIPDPKKYFLLVNALGAGEYYGPNRNGDFFEEKELQEHHKTFESLGKVYRHHRNKPKLGHRIYGDILYSQYNPHMHRVELVITLDIGAAPDLKEQIDRGEFPPLSMGSKVPYDICSICGNKAPKIQDYCEHAKTMMNVVMSDGRKVYVKNPKPKFFDISFIRVPADRTAYTLRKVASYADHIIPSAVKTAAELKNAGFKEADITKIIDGEIETASPDPRRLIVDSQPDMPKKLISELASSAPLNEVVSTMAAMRLMPKKAEFQRLVLESVGQKDLADEYERNKVAFIIHDEVEPIIPNDIGYRFFNEKTAGVIRKYSTYLEQAPMTKPVIMARIIEKWAELDNAHQTGSPMEQEGKLAPKILPTKNPLIPLAVIGGLYYGMSKLMNIAGDSGGMRSVLAKNPWLLPIFIGGATMGTLEVQKRYFEKNASGVGFLGSMLASVPATYLYAGAQESKVRRGEPIGSYSDFVRKNPLLSSIGHGFLASKATKLLSKTGEVKDRIFQASLSLDKNKFERIYNTIISG